MKTKRTQIPIVIVLRSLEPPLALSSFPDSVIENTDSKMLCSLYSRVLFNNSFTI